MFNTVIVRLDPAHYDLDHEELGRPKSNTARSTSHVKAHADASKWLVWERPVNSLIFFFNTFQCSHLSL